jgi:uncharacterized membrane protein
LKRVASVLSVLLGIFMIWAGVTHFLKPTFYVPFVPDFLPVREAFVALSGGVEILLGIAALVPRLRPTAGWGIMVLMFAFLPVHVWDVFRSAPAIGSHAAALIRLPIQFVFILWAGFVAKCAGKPAEVQVLQPWI